MILTERLRNLRKGKFSIEELASLLDVHYNTVSKWENGTQVPRRKHVAELAKLFGTSVAYLTGETDDPDEMEPPQKFGSRGVLVYQTASGERFEAPPTDKGIEYIEKMRVQVLRAQAKG